MFSSTVGPAPGQAGVAGDSWSLARTTDQTGLIILLKFQFAEYVHLRCANSLCDVQKAG